MKPKNIYFTACCLIISTIIYAQENKATTPQDSIDGLESLIALMPIIIYLLIIMSLYRKLRRDNVTFKDLLLDKEAMIEIEVQKTKQAQEISKTASKLNPDDAKTYLDQTIVANPKNNNDDNESETTKSSISRFLAFISGLTSIGIACIITTFYMWNKFDRKNITDLNELLTVILSLGIGVVPYGINKIGNAFSK